MQISGMFAGLAGFLETLRGVRFVFVPDPGNAGDSFIAHATYQFLDRMKFDYDIGDERETYPGRTVVYGSGGNMVSYYVNLNNFLLTNAPKCERIIVLPHTIRAYGETLAGLGSNCTIFCRDTVSYDFVQRHVKDAEVFLSHDMAFAVDFDATVTAARDFPLPLLSNGHFARRNIKRMALTAAFKMRSPRVLTAFRLDVEGTEMPIPSPNIDVSAVFATGNMSRIDALETTYRMMRFVRGFDTVNTNRLHVAIMAALLGRQVNFYDNSYGKNSAVFQHSMEGLFPNVIWCEESENPDLKQEPVSKKNVA